MSDKRYEENAARSALFEHIVLTIESSHADRFDRVVLHPTLFADFEFPVNSVGILMGRGRYFQFKIHENSSGVWVQYFYESSDPNYRPPTFFYPMSITLAQLRNIVNGLNNLINERLT